MDDGHWNANIWLIFGPFCCSSTSFDSSLKLLSKVFWVQLHQVTRLTANPNKPTRLQKIIRMFKDKWTQKWRNWFRGDVTKRGIKGVHLDRYRSRWSCDLFWHAGPIVELERWISFRSAGRIFPADQTRSAEERSGRDRDANPPVHRLPRHPGPHATKVRTSYANFKGTATCARHRTRQWVQT